MPGRESTKNPAALPPLKEDTFGNENVFEEVMMSPLRPPFRPIQEALKKPQSALMSTPSENQTNSKSRYLHHSPSSELATIEKTPPSPARVLHNTTPNGDNGTSEVSTPRMTLKFSKGPDNIPSSRNASSAHKTPRSARQRVGKRLDSSSSSSANTPTPTRNVSRTLKYSHHATASSSLNAKLPVSPHLAIRPIGLLQSKQAAQYANQSCTELISFDLIEDPSFWKNHNVQVLIRIRPLSASEISGQGQNRCLRQESPHTLTCLGPPESRFTFDHIAGENITQEKLFKIAGIPMVENSMSGYNSCMFAYGQTGSGKTHTMLGDIDELENRPSDNRGLTPRIFEYLFARIQKEEESHKQEHLRFVCKCSFLEIYNEQITDLLEPSSTNLQVREDIHKGVYVDNLSEIEVKNVQDVVHLLLQGAANRRVAATNMNRESSRSHSVFTCVIESKWEKDSITNIRFGRLNLVDLAGSERQKSSGAEGERLKEAANINKSLSTLGLVIMILIDVAHGKQRHIPYRDSKLTFLLQDSLGGNSKTTIIANISPSVSCAFETLSTLKFAQRAKLIQNNAVVNEDATGDVNALRLQIKQLKEELEKLRNQKSPSLVLKDLSESGENSDDFKGTINTADRIADASLRLNGARESSDLITSKKIKFMEAVVAGSLRREQVADNGAKLLAAEIEQLNRLVRQREDDSQCGKMILRFREDKIRRLEALSDGFISAESYLLEEKNTLMEEVHLLRACLDRNPELTRFAMENIRLMEQLRRFQDFYENGEREILLEEVANLRDQLLEIMEHKLAEEKNSPFLITQKESLVADMAAANQEKKLLQSEVDNYRKDLEECRCNLNSCVTANTKLSMEMDDLQTQLKVLKELCEQQQKELIHMNEYKVINSEQIKELELLKVQRNELNERLNDSFHEVVLLRSEIQDAKETLDTVKGIDDHLECTEASLNLTQEMATSAEATAKQIQQETEKLTLQQQQFLIGLNEVSYHNNKESGHRMIIDYAPMCSQNELSRVDVVKVKEIDDSYTSDSGLNIRLDKSKRVVEQITTDAKSELVANNLESQTQVRISAIKTNEELVELKLKFEDLLQENAKLVDMIDEINKEEDAQADLIEKEWEGATGKLLEYLAEGNQALNEAASEIEDMKKESSPCFIGIGTSENFQKKMFHIHKLARDAESTLRDLSEIALVLAKMQSWEKIEMQDPIGLEIQLVEENSREIKHGGGKVEEAERTVLNACATIEKLLMALHEATQSVSSVADKNLELLEKEHAELLTAEDNERQKEAEENFVLILEKEIVTSLLEENILGLQEKLRKFNLDERELKVERDSLNKEVEEVWLKTCEQETVSVLICSKLREQHANLIKAEEEVWRITKGFRCIEAQWSVEREQLTDEIEKLKSLLSIVKKETESLKLELGKLQEGKEIVGKQDDERVRENEMKILQLQHEIIELQIKLDGAECKLLESTTRLRDCSCNREHLYCVKSNLLKEIEGLQSLNMDKTKELSLLQKKVEGLEALCQDGEQALNDSELKSPLVQVELSDSKDELDEAFNSMHIDLRETQQVVNPVEGTIMFSEADLDVIGCQVAAIQMQKDSAIASLHVEINELKRVHSETLEKIEVIEKGIEIVVLQLENSCEKVSQLELERETLLLKLVEFEALAVQEDPKAHCLNAELILGENENLILRQMEDLQNLHMKVEHLETQNQRQLEDTSKQENAISKLTEELEQTHMKLQEMESQLRENNELLQLQSEKLNEYTELVSQVDMEKQKLEDEIAKWVSLVEELEEEQKQSHMEVRQLKLNFAIADANSKEEISRKDTLVSQMRVELEESHAALSEANSTFAQAEMEMQERASLVEKLLNEEVREALERASQLETEREKLQVENDRKFSLATELQKELQEANKNLDEFRLLLSKSEEENRKRGESLEKMNDSFRLSCENVLKLEDELAFAKNEIQQKEEKLFQFSRQMEQISKELEQLSEETEGSREGITKAEMKLSEYVQLLQKKELDLEYVRERLNDETDQHERELAGHLSKLQEMSVQLAKAHEYQQLEEQQREVVEPLCIEFIEKTIDYNASLEEQLKKDGELKTHGQQSQLLEQKLNTLKIELQHSHCLVENLKQSQVKELQAKDTEIHEITIKLERLLDIMGNETEMKDLRDELERGETKIKVLQEEIQARDTQIYKLSMQVDTISVSLAEMREERFNEERAISGWKNAHKDGSHFGFEAEEYANGINGKRDDKLQQQYNSTHEFSRKDSWMLQLEQENTELKAQMENLNIRCNFMEEELDDKRQAIEGMELDLFHLTSSIEKKIALSIENINQELALSMKEKDKLLAELLVVYEQLEMAQSLAEEHQAVATEARQIAEMSKTRAEQKENEAQLLENSVQEMESMVNALEMQVGIFKGEAERQRAMREDLERELQALRHQISDLSSFDMHEDLHRALESKEAQVVEVQMAMEKLKEHSRRKDEQIQRSNAYITELTIAIERQASDQQHKLRVLESMADQVKVVQNKCTCERTTVKLKGSGSPFKCIGSGLTQQMKSEIDEELQSNRKKVEELKKIAADRQKEIFKLTTRLAEAESVTHDVIRNLLGVKFDITNYTQNQEVKRMAEKARRKNEEAQEKEEELEQLRIRLTELIDERESWLDEIKCRQTEMVAIQITAEKLSQREKILTAENEQLQDANSGQQKRLGELEDEINKLLGHPNLKHRMHHHAKTKEESNSLRVQNEELRIKLQRTELMLNRVSEDLARYRSADVLSPHINTEDEQMLKAILKETEKEKIEVAQQLVSLCTSIVQAAGVVQPTREVGPTVALDALHHLQNRLETVEHELSSIKLKKRINGEKRRMNKLRVAHSPTKFTNFATSQICDTPFDSQ